MNKKSAFIVEAQLLRKMDLLTPLNDINVELVGDNF